jgi:carbamoyltransferase
MAPRVLGLSLSGHGASACLVEDGRVRGAVNLERLVRVKFAQAYPPAFLAAILAPALLRDGIPPDASGPPLSYDLFEVLPLMLEHVAGTRDPRGAGIDLIAMSRPIFTRPAHRAAYEVGERRLVRLFPRAQCVFDIEHHLLHAYQAYLCSPFEDAAILTVDGRGHPVERLGGACLSTTLAIGTGNRVELLEEIPVPHSLGGLYQKLTEHLGFGPEQEGNTMALAAFGTDRFVDEVAPTVRLHTDGRYELTESDGPRSFNPMARLDVRRVLLDKAPPRDREASIEQVHYDMAYALQHVCERVIVNAARALHERTGRKRIALAGGVALNCVANAKILEETPFEHMYVMPNAGDRGLAVAAALYGHHVILGHSERHPPAHDYLGRSYSEIEIRTALQEARGIQYMKSPDIAADCAGRIAAGQIIGWFQGGAEFGPRALGHRSILADPRTTRSKERLDGEIKRREWFRPYAPSVLAERAEAYFEMRGPSPYMLQAVRARPLASERVPGVIHVDGSARVQTVTREIEPRFYALIEAFEARTGIPMVLNTSFNGYGEPMVERPSEAVEALKAMSLDALAIGDYVVTPG